MLRTRQNLRLLSGLVLLSTGTFTPVVPCFAQNKESSHALLHSLERNDVAAAKKWLQKGASANARQPNGPTALGLAASKSNPTLARLLLDSGAQVNATYVDGRTALMEASIRNRVETTQLLLSRKAKVDAKDEIGRTALLWAAITARPNIVKTLLAHGANKDQADNSGQTALEWAKRITKNIQANGGKTYPSMRLAGQVIWGRGEEYMHDHHTGHADMKVVIAKLLSDYASVIKMLSPRTVSQPTLTQLKPGTDAK